MHCVVTVSCGFAGTFTCLRFRLIVPKHSFVVYIVEEFTVFPWQHAVAFSCHGCSSNSNNGEPDEVDIRLLDELTNYLAVPREQ